MTTTIGQRITAIGRRVLAQTAMSATVMTGLHFVSIADFPPARWIFGPDDAPQASTASVPLRTPAGVAPVRVVTLSSGSSAAVVPTGPAAPMLPAAGPLMPSEQRLAMIVPAKGEACGPSCTLVPRSVAHPTPRPVAPQVAAARLSAQPGSARPAVPQDARHGPAKAGEAMPVAAGLPVPDDVPMPPAVPAETGFVLADLIPGHQMVVEGVSFVGSQARDVVTGVASGALDLVGR